MADVIYIPTRGSGKSHTLLEQLKEDVANGKNIVFMTKECAVEFEKLKAYEPTKYDDVPDNVRYAMECLGIWKGEQNGNK